MTAGDNDTASSLAAISPFKRRVTRFKVGIDAISCAQRGGSSQS
jgi:hypothetical protein